jgi:alpha-beta hydrolase superfamily lysophospholipase
MFHGYSGEKSSLITRAEKLHELGYQLFLVDFRGSGGSTGNATTIGHSESKEVVDVFNYIEGMGETNIILFGTSMGAAAILKSLDESNIKPSAIMLECPFGQLDKTVAARFKVMGVPAFPLSDVLTFWGGLQHGYWAFSHNPEEYARAVTCPTLLMFGEKDDRVSREETDAIRKKVMLCSRKGIKTIGFATYPYFFPEPTAHTMFPGQSNWKRCAG